LKRKLLLYGGSVLGCVRRTQGWLATRLAWKARKAGHCALAQSLPSSSTSSALGTLDTGTGWKSSGSADAGPVPSGKSPYSRLLADCRVRCTSVLRPE
jgi:hypothetical protein